MIPTGRQLDLFSGTEEDICIGLSDSGETQELDFIHVSTICVPEPASLALLTIGGFALLRKRKSQRQHFNK